MENITLNITEAPENVTLKIEECLSRVYVDGITITGTGRPTSPLTVVAGSGDMLRSTYDPTNVNASAFDMENMIEGATKKILTSAERTKLNNLSGTNTGDQDLTPYLTSATAAATYQPIGSYLTTISGLNISQLTNDSGYITSAALSPYLTTAAAAATYQPILVSGTTIKTINGTSLLGSGDITISAAAALSSITAATSSNIINNGNFTQEWTWNSISGQSGLKLSSTANGTTSNKTQKLFESVLTGAMFNTSNASYAGYFDNQQTVGGAYGIYARGYTAARFDGFVIITNVLTVHGATIGQSGGQYFIKPPTGQALYIDTDYGGFTNNSQSSGVFFGFNKVSSERCVFGINGRYQKSSANYRTSSTSATIIEHNAGKLTFAVNSGLSGVDGTPFTPNVIQTIVASTSNIGIGTTSPDVSAKLDVSSTTQGFAPPEMTATQASAITTTTRKLIIYVTDTNGTFTSAGLWMWNGTTWKLILAE